MVFSFWYTIWFGLVAVPGLPLLSESSCAEQIVETAFLSVLGCPVIVSLSASGRVAEPILAREG